MSTTIYQASNKQPIWGKLFLVGVLVTVHGLLILKAQMPVSVAKLEAASKQAYNAPATAWHAEYQVAKNPKS